MNQSTNRRGFLASICGLALLGPAASVAQTSGNAFQVLEGECGVIFTRGIDVQYQNNMTLYVHVTTENEFGVTREFRAVPFNAYKRFDTLWRGGLMSDQELRSALEQASTAT